MATNAALRATATDAPAQNRQLASKQVFTTGEAAKLCNLSQQTIIRCFDDGRLRGFRVPGSRSRRIPRQELVRFMRAHQIPLEILGETAVTMLVIDHEDDTIGLVSQVADWLGGIDVKIATTAYDAGVMTAKTGPQVALLNARLPDIDIVSACRTLRKANGTPSAQVIVLATKFRQEEIAALQSEGVEHFLRKPFTRDEFAATLQRALAG